MASQFHRDDPRTHAADIRHLLGEAVDRLDQDVGAVTDARAKALFETAREVIMGLVRAFDHYEQAEPAWRDSRPET